MSKYKVIGILNLISGFSQSAYSLLMFFVVLPKILVLYSDVNITPFTAYVTLGVLFSLGLLNLLVAFMLLRDKGDKERNLKLGVM